MIKIVAKMNVQADKVEDFKAMAVELVAKSREEEGNIAYSLNQSVSDPTVLAFIEYWRDQEAIDIHNATEHFTRILPKLAEMCTGAPDIALFNEVC